MNTVGRRALLMGGCTVMGSAHVIISVLVGLYSSNWPAYRDAGRASVAMLFIYMLFFGGLVGPIGWALPNEIFPCSSAPKASPHQPARTWLNNFIIGLITPLLIQNTNYGTYIFFAVWCYLYVIWTFFFVPETKGRSLEQMDHVFKANPSEEEKERRRAIEGEIFRAAEGV